MYATPPPMIQDILFQIHIEIRCNASPDLSKISDLGLKVSESPRLRVYGYLKKTQKPKDTETRRLRDPETQRPRDPGI